MSAVERPIEVDPSRLLELEADDAKAAITRVIREMGQQVQAGVDPRRLTKEHPWIAVGSAAVTGFIGAWLAVPSKEDAALKRLARIERALHAGPSANGAPDDANTSHPALRKFGKHLFNALRPTLLAALTSALTSKVADSDDDADAVVQEEEITTAEGQFYQPPPG